MNITTYHSAAEIPGEAWEAVVGSASITHGKTYWQVIEAAGMAEFHDTHYLLVRDARGQPLAIATCYTVSTDMAIFASGPLRALLQTVRRAFPRFLKLRMLECGSAININPPLLTRPGADVDAVVDRVSDELFEIARRQGALLLVVRDFTLADQGLLAGFERNGFVAVPGLPNAWMDVAWSSVDEYLAAMKSYYRSKLKKHLKRNEQAGISARLLDEFSDIADTLAAQWMKVHEQADEYQREVLTPVFYRAFSRRLGEASRVIGFYRDGRMIGHALLLMDRDTLRWMYFGREQAQNDSLYIFVAFKVIETAITLGAAHIELGLTTYSIKRDLGARLIPIRYGLSFRFRWMNPVLGWGYRLLNKTPEIRDKNIFKQPSGNT